MPSGRTHLRIEGALLVVWMAAAVLCGRWEWVSTTEIAGFLSAYLFSMFLLSPDLDLAESDSYHRWGLLRWLWAPYAAAFRHRRVSHHPLFGPITRIAYVALMGWVALLAWVLVGRRETARVVLSIDLVLAVFIGLYLPNLTHIAVDGLQSAWGRLRRRL